MTNVEPNSQERGGDILCGSGVGMNTSRPLPGEGGNLGNNQ